MTKQELIRTIMGKKIDRRDFMKKAALGVAGIFIIGVKAFSNTFEKIQYNLTTNGTGFSPSALTKTRRNAQPVVRFGMFTDLHYARRTPAGDRFYKDSITKAGTAMEEFKKQPMDFIIELGDFKDQGPKPSKDETLSFLKEIEASIQSYGIPFYHVLGNHDMDSLSKSDFLSNTKNPRGADGKNYYSYKVKGIKFIVLDANYNADFSDYDKGNFNWTVANVPQHELDWLQKELEDGDGPVVVFIHQLLDNKGGLYKGLYVRNADAVNRILTGSKRVLAVIQGHHHKGCYSTQDNIHYFTMPGMITDPIPANSYAIVDIMGDGNIRINGVGNCPDKMMQKL